MRFAVVVASLLLCALSPQIAATPDILLGHPAAALNGPWKFRTGDDARWADPAFDDSGWESVDLTPAPGAHDPDVGLIDYVPGWMARGHAGYSGFAWYRLAFHWSVPPGTRPLLLGPAYVEDAYEIYWNGARVAASGDFAANPPRAFATRPALLSLPVQGSSGRGLLAIRVYLTPSIGREPDAGGIHIAPVLVGEEAAAAWYGAQWSRTFLGYVVDVIEPVLFVLIALFALSLSRFSGADHFYRGLAIALVLVAAIRVNQAVFFWTEIEDLHSFMFLKYAILEPAILMAWTFTWNRWSESRVRWVDWLAAALAILTLCIALSAAELEVVRRMLRGGFVVLLGVIAIRIVRHDRLRALALAVMVLTAVGLFAEELSLLGVPGIWFPFGVGVSRTQYAYALLIPLLAALCHLRSSPTALHDRIGRTAGLPESSRVLPADTRN
jgi:hypothetical protein